MGWGSGGHLADEVWKAFEDVFSNEDPAKVEQFARKLVGAFKEQALTDRFDCAGLLGDIATRLDRERDGAPKTPLTGELFTDPYGDRWLFNGRRWVYQLE